MGLQDDVSTAATDFVAETARLISDVTRLAALVNGPATGPASQVTVDSGPLKTLARVIAEAIGRLGPMRGDWSGATAYAAGDVVRRSNKIFVAMQASSGADPASETDGPNWFLFVDPQTAFNAVLGTFALQADIAPAAIVADQNDFSPAGLSGATVLRLSASAAHVITGLDGGADGRCSQWSNVGLTSRLAEVVGLARRQPVCDVGHAAARAGAGLPLSL